MNQESESKGHTFHPDRYLPTLADFGNLSPDKRNAPRWEGRRYAAVVMNFSVANCNSI
jgi:hypothetical protein